MFYLSQQVALNDTYTTSDNKENNLNCTFTKNSGPNQSQSFRNERCNNYEVTPERKKAKPDNIVKKDDYDIKDIKSDDSTDDETAPKKKIPSWATSK